MIGNMFVDLFKNVQYRHATPTAAAAQANGQLPALAANLFEARFDTSLRLSSRWRYRARHKSSSGGRFAQNARTPATAALRAPTCNRSSRSPDTGGRLSLLDGTSSSCAGRGQCHRAPLFVRRNARHSWPVGEFSADRESWLSRRRSLPCCMTGPWSVSSRRLIRWVRAIHTALIEHNTAHRGTRPASATMALASASLSRWQWCPQTTRRSAMARSRVADQ